MFSCEFREIFQEHIFIEQLRVLLLDMNWVNPVDANWNWNSNTKTRLQVEITSEITGKHKK